MEIVGAIVSGLMNNGLRRASLIVNGQQMVHSGRRVYVEVDNRNKQNVNFFTRVYNKQQQTTEVEYLDSQLSVLKSQLHNYILFNVRFDVGKVSVMPEVRIDADNEIVFINSALYCIGRALNEATGTPKTVVFGDGYLDESQTSAIKKLFLRNALESYGEIIYSTNVNRFVKSLVRSNKLYGITPYSFVPVFIKFDGLFDPLSCKDLGVEDTFMYNTAVEKGRFVSNGSVSAYFLTHKEICKCFGMHRFARFTPHVWYSLFVGLLQPSSTYFPNKIAKVIKWNDETPPPVGYKSVYNQEDFTANVLSVENGLTDEELSHYELVDTLEAFVAKEYTTLRNVGPYYLDERSRVTRGFLYDIYSEAVLRYGSRVS